MGSLGLDRTVTVVFGTEGFGRAVLDSQGECWTGTLRSGSQG